MPAPGSSGSLADALRRMHDSPPADQHARRNDDPGARNHPLPDAVPDLADACRPAHPSADDDHHDTHRPAPRPESPLSAPLPESPRQRAARAARRSPDLRRPAMALLVLLAVALLVPAVWAAALLLGFDVPLAARDRAAAMAWLMMTAWPISAVLCATALVLRARIRRDQHARRP